MKHLFKLALAGAAVTAAFSATAATTLTVASFPSFDRAVKEALPLWKKAHPDIEIKLVSLNYGDHHTAMTTALATGSNLPDVMAVEVGFIGRFAESGGLEDLSKAPYSALPNQSKFFAFTYPQAMGHANGLAAIPADIGPGTMFYRKDLMDKAGISEADLTKSWEGYIESGKKLKTSTGAYLLAHASDIQGIYIRSGLKDGQGVYFDKDGKTLVDTPRFQKAFELAKAARAAGIDAKIGAWSNEWSEGFKTNKIASQMMGAWLAGHLADWLAPATKGLWRSSNLPGGSFGSYGGSFYAIAKKAQNKTEAWEFIKFMTLNKEVQINSFRTLDAFPALIEAQKDGFTDQPMEFLGGQKARQLWRDISVKIPAIKVDKFDPIAAEIVNAELENVLEQGKDVKTALADAKTMIEKRVRR
ncbi:MAG: extracellular solute-binding protein [Pseudomonadota bacterium]